VIEAVLDEKVEAGTFLRMEPGTLRLRKVRENEASTFTALQDMEAGEAVFIIPLDATKLQVGFGVQVASTRGKL
jgi:hypothetical protein